MTRAVFWKRTRSTFVNSMLTSSALIVAESSENTCAMVHISDTSTASSALPLGDFAPLTHHVRDADHLGETIYVNRRNVTHITPRGSGSFVHLVGGGSIEVAESAREAAERLS